MMKLLEAISVRFRWDNAGFIGVIGNPPPEQSTYRHGLYTIDNKSHFVLGSPTFKGRLLFPVELIPFRNTFVSLLPVRPLYPII